MTSNQPGKLTRGLKKADFDLIFREGKKATGNIVRIVSRNGLGRTGFSSSKNIGDHPRRNRGRRRIKEALRLQPELVQESLDYVLIALHPSVTASFIEVQAEVQQLMSTLNKKWDEQSASS